MLQTELELVLPLTACVELYYCATSTATADSDEVTPSELHGVQLEVQLEVPEVAALHWQPECQ